MKRKKYLGVIITADVKKRKLQYLEHIQEKGQSESKVTEKQIKEECERYKIKKFYGDSAYDTNNMFDIFQSVAGVKIRKNITLENIKGSKIKKKQG
ncbi:MAG: IS5/IS1182 family transposase, partial [Thermoplasmatales archaeon]